MNPYRITVILAHQSDVQDRNSFPEPSVFNDSLQFLHVTEDNPYDPHHRSLEAISDAQGEFTIILDEGDCFSADFLTNLETLMQQNPSVAFAMPQMRFQLYSDPPFYFDPNLSEATVINADAPLVFPTELHGLLFRTAFLLPVISDICPKDVPFPIEVEKRILLNLLSSWPSFIFVGGCRLDYCVPKECDFQYDLHSFLHDWYFDPLESFLLPLLTEQHQNSPCVPPLLQYLTLYMLQCRMNANMNNRNKHILESVEINDYASLFSALLQFVDVRTILSSECSLCTAPRAVQLLELQMKKECYEYRPHFQSVDSNLSLYCDDILFCNRKDFPVSLSLIDFSSGHLEIDGSIPDYFTADSAELFAVINKQYIPVVCNKRYSMSKCFGITYHRARTFHVSVPLAPPETEQILRFVIRFQQKEYEMMLAFPAHTSRFSKDFTYGYWCFGDYFSYLKQHKIHIIRTGRLLVLYKEFRLWQQMWSLKNGQFRSQLPLKILNFLLQPYFSRRKIWLFFDKIYKGGDSSEYIYRYAQEQKDSIHKYYLLDPNCADYKRMKQAGYHPLRRGSLKHQLIFLNADLVIASNSTVFAFNDYTFERSLPIRGVIHFDVACVQHGMSIQKIALAQQRLRDNTKLYFCASKYEIENLSKPVYDYAGYNILKLTGVPRYDGLKNRAQKVLLISPTWRMNSAMPVTRSEGVARDYNPNFKDTSYFKVYNNLINDPRLLSEVRKHGYRIQYVLHPIVSPQYDDFTKNDLVDIIPATGDMSYEKIFCESALMVTDFSGVQFDFAYMRKPVVYLHHNEIPQHYENGTFYYDTMGFGEICHTNEELIDVLCSYMEQNCVMPELYRKRADDFFAFSDDHNCQRIYPIMLEHTKKQES